MRFRSWMHSQPISSLLPCKFYFHWSNFQLRFDYKPGLFWLCFASLCDWFRKLAPSPQPIRCDLVARVFPRFRQFVCIYSEFSLANDDVYPCGDWPLLLILFWHFVIQLKTALTLIQSYPSQFPLLLKKKCEIRFS